MVIIMKFTQRRKHGGGGTWPKIGSVSLQRVRDKTIRKTTTAAWKKQNKTKKTKNKTKQNKTKQ